MVGLLFASSILHWRGAPLATGALEAARNHVKGTHRATCSAGFLLVFLVFLFFLSFSGSAQKLTVMDIASSDIAVKVVRPDRKNPSPRSALPEPLVVTAHAHTSWNNSTLYEEVYRRQPYQSNALQTRVLNRELIVGSPASPSSLVRGRRSSCCLFMISFPDT
jgi:hypothetical protein